MEQVDVDMEEAEWATDPDYILSVVNELGFTPFLNCDRSLTRTATGLQYCLNTPHYSALIDATPGNDRAWVCRMWLILSSVPSIEDALLPLTILQACEEPMETAMLFPDTAVDDLAENDEYYSLMLDCLTTDVATVLASMEKEVNRCVAVEKTRLICSLAKNLQFFQVHYSTDAGNPCEIYYGKWHEGRVAFRVKHDKVALKRQAPGRFGVSWREEVFFEQDMFRLGKDKEICLPLDSLRTSLQIPENESFFNWLQFPLTETIPVLSPVELAVVFSIASWDYGFWVYDNVEDYRLAAPYRFPLNKKRVYPLR